MACSKIEDVITFEIDITEMLLEAEAVIIKVIHNNKIIKIDQYKRRNNHVRKRRIIEN